MVNCQAGRVQKTRATQVSQRAIPAEAGREGQTELCQKLRALSSSDAAASGLCHQDGSLQGPHTGVGHDVIMM